MLARSAHCGPRSARTERRTSPATSTSEDAPRAWTSHPTNTKNATVTPSVWCPPSLGSSAKETSRSVSATRAAKQRAGSGERSANVAAMATSMSEESMPIRSAISAPLSSTTNSFPFGRYGSTTSHRAATSLTGNGPIRSQSREQSDSRGRAPSQQSPLTLLTGPAERTGERAADADADHTGVGSSPCGDVTLDWAASSAAKYVPRKLFKDVNSGTI